MNVFAIMLVLVTAANTFHGGESKPLFFDAVTGALNEIRKIFFGDHHGMYFQTSLFEKQVNIFSAAKVSML